MAVVECIPEKSQNPSAQKGVLDYCMQPSKTLEEGEQLAYVSGINCIPELANESFLATQKHFGCKAGMCGSITMCNPSDRRKGCPLSRLMTLAWNLRRASATGK